MSGTPVQVVHTGEASAAALLSNGTVETWGLNANGQLGTGAAKVGTASRVPVLVPGLSGVVQVAGGSETVLALTSAGTVWAWGLDDEGELGNGASGWTPTPPSRSRCPA
jgi:alpha-tubulin suppressor-like RCC1 family protein